MEIRRKIARNLINYSGWKTNRKIIVFESDDWGSIRMPSNSVYKKLIKRGIPVDKSPYCKYDSLASEEDLHALFDTLNKFKDSRNNPPVFTANAVVSNPDFKKIKSTNYQEYYFELINNTFKKYPAHSNCIKLWKEGKKAGIFYPQLHGREHLNVQLWLKLLQNGNPDFLFAFKNRCWGLSGSVYSSMRMSIQAALDMEDRSEIDFQKKMIKEGCDLFEKIMGYRSETFIANNYIWDSILNKSLYENGVRYLQGMKFQKAPLLNHKDRKMIRHFMGEKNEFNQYYLIRNCVFEPTLKKSNFDNVGECIKDIANAFFWKKPAIIVSHRLNYVGHLHPKNRRTNLNLLEDLLENILKKWPDVEFMTSNYLGKVIENDN